MRSFNSSGECKASSAAPGCRPQSFNSQLPIPFRTTIAGHNRTRNSQSGRTTASAVRSLRCNARLFGINSPSTIWSAVMMLKAITTAMTCAPASANRPNPKRRGSMRRASAGSPIQPRPSEEMVMPSWQAARLASSWESARSSALAFLFPLATSRWTRLRRTATIENSAATKKPLAATSKKTAKMPIKSVKLPSPVGMILSFNLTNEGMSPKNRLVARRCRDPVSQARAVPGSTALVRLFRFRPLRPATDTDSARRLSAFRHAILVRNSRGAVACRAVGDARFGGRHGPSFHPVQPEPLARPSLLYPDRHLLLADRHLPASSRGGGRSVFRDRLLPDVGRRSPRRHRLGCHLYLDQSLPALSPGA